MEKDKIDAMPSGKKMSFLAPQAGRKQEKSSSSEKTGRNKVALKPGHSLMDWIKLQQFATAQQIRPVSVEELRKHNKCNDAWICLQGKVYDITPYMEYHPGGAEELMKGAGKDATELFNQVHRWVNAESMLKKCFVGPLKLPSLWLQSDITEKETNSDSMLPKFDWAETDSSVSILVQSSKKNTDKESLSVSTDLIGSKMFLTVKFLDSIHKYKVELCGKVSSDYKVRKKHHIVEVLLQKISNDRWKDLQFSLMKSITGYESQCRDISYRPCKLVRKSSVNYNTSLLTFELPPETQMLIPIGHHIQIKILCSGDDVIRSYTPIATSLFSDDASSSGVSCITLMVKFYSSGVLTPILDKLSIGETVFISDSVGEFSEETLKTTSTLVLLAAGTGFTPMIRILLFCLKSKETKLRKCSMIFFNKTKNDILWRDQLKLLSEEDNRFHVFHVLSEPDSDWDGMTGRISKQLIDDIISPELKNADINFCVCGPITFSKMTSRYLNELGYADEKVHIFLG